ncbi:hypothetical protein PanWU01x14_020550 [Parasponia andersonii]|uniref:Transmembrane protein n=1 Tax=Parasponia andersonii TaxID=3476 RepID=A0A2P5DYR8_PARAD|nr:hypothetical protein PanWU01x14_020550 [Parasponia andersonii]
MRKTKWYSANLFYLYMYCWFLNLSPIHSNDYSKATVHLAEPSPLAHQPIRVSFTLVLWSLSLSLSLSLASCRVSLKLEATGLSLKLDAAGLSLKLDAVSSARAQLRLPPHPLALSPLVSAQILVKWGVFIIMARSLSNMILKGISGLPAANSGRLVRFCTLFHAI